jgi:hypothetical protein
MTSSDNIIIQDSSGTLQRGFSKSLNAKEVIGETAIRSARILLTYSENETSDNEIKLQSILGKSAKKQAEELLAPWRKKFNEFQLNQIPQITNIIIDNNQPDNQAVSYVFGFLHRKGFYLGMPYYQKLSFKLGMRLARTKSNEEYPYKVLKFVYHEKSLFNNNIQNSRKGKV